MDFWAYIRPQGLGAALSLGFRQMATGEAKISKRTAPLLANGQCCRFGKGPTLKFANIRCIGATSFGNNLFPLAGKSFFKEPISPLVVDNTVLNQKLGTALSLIFRQKETILKNQSDSDVHLVGKWSAPSISQNGRPLTLSSRFVAS